MVLTPCAALGIYQVISVDGQAVGGSVDDTYSAHSESADQVSLT
jgi:hypothetical protein